MGHAPSIIHVRAWFQVKLIASGPSSLTQPSICRVASSPVNPLISSYDPELPLELTMSMTISVKNTRKTGVSENTEQIVYIVCLFVTT